MLGHKPASRRLPLSTSSLSTAPPPRLKHDHCIAISTDTHEKGDQSEEHSVVGVKKSRKTVNTVLGRVVCVDGSRDPCSTADIFIHFHPLSPPLFHQLLCLTTSKLCWWKLIHLRHGSDSYIYIYMPASHYASPPYDTSACKITRLLEMFHPSLLSSMWPDSDKHTWLAQMILSLSHILTPCSIVLINLEVRKNYENIKY